MLLGTGVAGAKSEVFHCRVSAGNERSGTSRAHIEELHRDALSDLFRCSPVLRSQAETRETYHDIGSKKGTQRTWVEIPAIAGVMTPRSSHLRI